MRIAVPTETLAYETRIAATPETVKKFIAAGCEVVVQKAAGEHADLTDAAFVDAGASLAGTFAETCNNADLVVKVRAPSKEELMQLASGTVIASLMSPFSNPLLNDYAKAGLSCFCLEMIPRISRAQSMDVLSSQANIAGYKAVFLALEHYKSFMPMLMTAAGTVQPAKVLIMGAGVAGLQAIATARRLGAMVEVFDVRAAAKEQVESLGAKFVEVPTDDADGEDAGGYAKEMSDEYKEKQAALIAEHAAKSDIIITTALIPGRPAPVLVTEETLSNMKAGSVIVDMAAEAGGNCPLTEKDAVWIKDGVTLVGTSNIPALMATDASQLFARNVFNFISPMLTAESNGKSNDEPVSLNINMDDEVIAASLICKDGEFLKPQLLGEKE